MKSDKIFYIYCGKKIGKVFVSEEVFRSFKQLVNHIYYDNSKYKRAPRAYFSADFEYEYGDFVENAVAAPLFDYVEYDFKRRLHEALFELCEEERQLVYLLYFAGYSLNEVAVLQHSYKMAIARRRDKILKKLRDKLKMYESYVN